MYDVELVQGSPEWRAARVGSLGASRVVDAITKTKTGWGASRKNLLADLVAERLTGQPADKFTNAAMQWGTETEPQARAAYCFYHGQEVRQVGLIRHPIIAGTHASPDGLVGDDGLIEIKCPNTATHIETLISKGASVDGKYFTQMQWQMACTGRQWCDFVSFDPRMPEQLRLFVMRVERNPERIAELHDLVSEFLAEVEATTAALERIAA
jgi:putative phage-type endonuclease